MKHYFPIDDTHELEIQIRYTLGGINPLSFKEEKRGYYVHFDVVKHEGSFIISQMIGALDGIDLKTGKVLLKPVNRKNENTYRRICAALNFEKLDRLWQNKEYSEAFKYLDTLEI